MATVHIPHIFTKQLDQRDTDYYEAAKNVYVLIHGTPPIETAEFIHYLNSALMLRGGRVAAFRVVTEDLPDPYQAELEPSGVLHVRVQSCDTKKTEKTEKVKDKDGNESESTTWIFEGAIELQARFDSIQTGQLFDEPFFFSQEDEIKYPTKSQEQVLKNVLVRETLKKLAVRISPMSTVMCARPIFKIKEDKESETAFRHARNANWPVADEIWLKRLNEGRGGWRDSLGLAVGAERRGDYENARTLYQQAETKSQGDKEASTIQWSSIYDELSRISQNIPASPSTEKWFDRRVAVLPFADEVVSLDGPTLINELFFKMMKTGGYNVIPLEEVEEVLKNHGFSDGGQLVAVTPEKIGQWLKADWLVFGNIEKFDEVNLGIFVRRSIAGKISIWDATKKQEIWSSSLPYKKEGFKDGNVLMNFLGELGKSWIDRLAKSPMGDEVQAFVTANIETLPRRPS